MNTTRSVLLVSISLAGLSLIALAPSASACTIDLGNCSGGNCVVNGVGSSCADGGSCLVNGVYAYCGSTGSCWINGVLAQCYGNCLVNIALTRC